MFSLPHLLHHTFPFLPLESSPLTFLHSPSHIIFLFFLFFPSHSAFSPSHSLPLTCTLSSYFLVASPHSPPSQPHILPLTYILSSYLLIALLHTPRLLTSPNIFPPRSIPYLLWTLFHSCFFYPPSSFLFNFPNFLLRLIASFSPRHASHIYILVFSPLAFHPQPFLFSCPCSVSFLFLVFSFSLPFHLATPSHSHQHLPPCVSCSLFLT